MNSAPKKPKNGDGRLYQLKIVLQYSDPEIWRRVIVPADTLLGSLHDIIQTVMGWENCHMYQFVVGKTRKDLVCYGPSDPEFEDDDPKMLDDMKHSIRKIAPRARQKFGYEYDFGDSWQHLITVEKTLPADPSFKHAHCVGGEGQCPPEDCGGIYGYDDLRQILGDPKHPEHESTKAWAGDIEGKFNPAPINRRLRQLKV